MIKIVYPDEQEELLKAAGRLSSFFDDDSASMKKAASSAFSEKMIRDNAPDSDHFGVHFIGLGAGESYNANKNGDWWDRGDEKHGLIGRHHTFVKNGHFFLEHRNSNPSLAIGKIAASGFNRDMDRVEVIVHGNKEKCPDIYEDAKSGKDIDCSMSARVPFDICSCCGQKSASSKNYCAHAKYSMNQWVPSHSKFAYVRNPDPTFFDLSKVANRADRIARHLEFIFNKEDDLKKAASENRFVFSDERATAAGILIPDEKQLGCVRPGKQAWLEKLANAENRLSHFPLDPAIYLYKHSAFEPDVITEEQMAQMHKIHSDVLFRKLAMQSITLPFLPFTAYITRQTIKQASANSAYIGALPSLPKLFCGALEMDANAELENAFQHASLFKSASFSPDNEFKKMLEHLSNGLSVDPATAHIRIMRISISGHSRSKEEQENKKKEENKKASALTEEQKKESSKLLRAYAMYKIAACEIMEDLQKTVDERTLLLISSQNLN